jgi:hypothetical protein
VHRTSPVLQQVHEIEVRIEKHGAAMEPIDVITVLTSISSDNRIANVLNRNRHSNTKRGKFP